MIAGASACLLVAGCDYESVEPVGTWNGKKVFLSPAHHGGYGNPPVLKTGCNGYVENDGALAIARQASTVGGGLAAMGYKVRIGRRDRRTNRENSNAWKSTVHVPIHSNANNENYPSAYDCTPPYNLDQSFSGTEIFHAGSTKGTKLAQALLNRLRSASPGRGSDDLRDGNHLGEVSNTTMPAAYVEMAYHTFGPDMASMRDAPNWWGALIAIGIDQGIASF